MTLLAPRLRLQRLGWACANSLRTVVEAALVSSEATFGRYHSTGEEHQVTWVGDSELQRVSLFIFLTG